MATENFTWKVSNGVLADTTGSVLGMEQSIKNYGIGEKDGLYQFQVQGKVAHYNF